MTTDSREQILDAAAAALDDGRTVSLESVARESGLSKPGLMYHFGTKEALMLALVDHTVDGWDGELRRRLGMPLEEATPRQRITAYVGWALSGQVGQGSLVMLADPRLREPLRARWIERLEPWVQLPSGMTADERARLSAVRLLADGAWFSDATETFVLAEEDRDRVRRLAERLLGA